MGFRISGSQFSISGLLRGVGLRNLWHHYTNSPQRVACSDDTPKSHYLRSGSIVVEYKP